MYTEKEVQQLFHYGTAAKTQHSPTNNVAELQLVEELRVRESKLQLPIARWLLNQEYRRGAA